MKKKNILFKIGLVIFLVAILYLFIRTASHFIARNDNQISEIDTIILPGNSKFSHVYTMPYDGNLWIRLKRTDNIALPSNEELLDDLYIINICTSNYQYNEIRTIENTYLIDNKRRICRQEYEYGKIITSLHDLDKKILIDSIKFPEYDMSLGDITIAGFHSLKKGQQLQIKVVTTMSNINTRVAKFAYNLAIESIELQ